MKTKKYKDISLTGQYRCGKLKENNFMCRGMKLRESNLWQYGQKCISNRCYVISTFTRVPFGLPCRTNDLWYFFMHFWPNFNLLC